MKTSLFASSEGTVLADTSASQVHSCILGSQFISTWRKMFWLRNTFLQRSMTYLWLWHVCIMGALFSSSWNPDEESLFSSFRNIKTTVLLEELVFSCTTSTISNKVNNRNLKISQMDLCGTYVSLGMHLVKRILGNCVWAVELSNFLRYKCPVHVLEQGPYIYSPDAESGGKIFAG